MSSRSLSIGATISLNIEIVRVGSKFGLATLWNNWICYRIGSPQATLVRLTIMILVAVTLFWKPCAASDALSIRVFETSRSGAQLTEKSASVVTSVDSPTIPTIRIRSDLSFQEIVGFGGAFTESSAFVLSQLSGEKRAEVIRAYFSPTGAHYSLTRTHINSCDFSLSNYAYCDTPGDTDLKDFSIQEDLDDLVPLIRDAMKIPGADFKIIASPWTAPPWMKDNNEWNGGSLKPEYYSTWALYFCKYIEAYRQQGIPIWAITVENEPLGNGAQWESMIYTPSQMADFIKRHLGPKFRDGGLDCKILIYDQNRDHLKEWAEQILGDAEVAKHVWGTAIHWYSSTYDWYPEVLTAVHEAFPTKALLHTEGCVDAEVPVWQDDDWYWRKEATDWGFDWAPDEEKHLHPKYVPVYRYARDIIGGLNSWVAGWVDWNIVLDDKGGPNHAKNWCVAPVLIKPETGEVYYTPLYYVMAHFSKFIRPGAVRVGVESNLKDVMVTACINPDKSLAVVALNQSDESLECHLLLDDIRIGLTIQEQSMQTIVVESTQLKANNN